MSGKKELNELRRIAEQQGWKVTQTKGDHMKWLPPDGGPFVITSASPSTSNIIKTIKHQLQKRGLALGNGRRTA